MVANMTPEQVAESNKLYDEFNEVAKKAGLRNSQVLLALLAMQNGIAENMHESLAAKDKSPNRPNLSECREAMGEMLYHAFTSDQTRELINTPPQGKA